MTETFLQSNGQSGCTTAALIGIGGIIVAPADSTPNNPTIFQLSTPTISSPGPPSIPFTAAKLQASDAIDWKATTSYRTSGGVQSSSGPTQLPGPQPSQSVTLTQPFTGLGGKVLVDATAEGYKDEITVYIVGPPTSPGISYGDITNELTNLYKGITTIYPNGSSRPGVAFTPATSGLMTQIAPVESSYLQFARENLYGLGSDKFWPLESPEQKNPQTGKVISRAGAHIGLMQVPTTMADGWNWLQNAQDGVILPSQNSFQSKLGMASARGASMQAAHSGLQPTLTNCQLEEMALRLFGPFAGGKDLTRQYYIPLCVGGANNGQTGAMCPGGSWQWSINAAGKKVNRCGVCYVVKVRSRVPPTGGSTTKCPATSAIPADPPTGVNCGDCGA